jgi:lipopolysaccharide kinase (Kdo/WaaP) family protein
VSHAEGLPAGYVRFRLRHTDVVALAECASTVRKALAGDTLYGFAAHHPARRALEGRIPVYAIPFPDDATRVVVRHATHGGALARFTGDLFLTPRAPIELAASRRLHDAGVPTPQVVAYAIYGGVLVRRADVATREVRGRDLVAWLGDDLDAASREVVFDAVVALLAALANAGAWHPDLNAKNVLIDHHEGALRAWVLDVDRVTFGAPHDASIVGANAQRLVRSLEKWRRTRGLRVSDEEIARVSSTAPTVEGARS